MKILVQLIGNNICGPAVGSCWSVLFFLLITFTISNCVHISLLLTVAMKWGDTYFWCMMKMHAYAFLLKLKSICQIAFQGIHDVLAVSILPFSNRKTASVSSSCLFLLIPSHTLLSLSDVKFLCCFPQPIVFWIASMYILIPPQALYVMVTKVSITLQSCLLQCQSLRQFISS